MNPQALPGTLICFEVIDLGCGAGVLSMLALRAGSALVLLRSQTQTHSESASLLQEACSLQRLTLGNAGATEVLGVDHSPHLARCARRVLAHEDKAPGRGATHRQACKACACFFLFSRSCIPRACATSQVRKQ